MPDRKNINEATREDIAELPFMSEQRAEMIVHYREVNGPYKKEKDLQNVTGINERLASRVAEYFEISEMETSSDRGRDDDRDGDRSGSRRTRASDEDIDKAIKDDEEADDKGGDDDKEGGGRRTPRRSSSSSR